jgi:hypothetical protein
MTEPTDITEARRRRDERRELVGRLADFATGLPWSQDVREHPEFVERFPTASLADMEASQTELSRRLAVMAESGLQLDLPCRVGLCATAADWLRARPHISNPLVDPEFRDLFGHLSRAELVIMASLRGQIPSE